MNFKFFEWFCGLFGVSKPVVPKNDVEAFGYQLRPLVIYLNSYLSDGHAVTPQYTLISGLSSEVKRVDETLIIDIDSRFRSRGSNFWDVRYRIATRIVGLDEYVIEIDGILDEKGNRLDSQNEISQDSSPVWFLFECDMIVSFEYTNNPRILIALENIVKVLEATKRALESY